MGNKADMPDDKRAVTYAQGKALADEFGLNFFESSANSGQNVEDVFVSIAGDVKTRLDAQVGDGEAEEATTVRPTKSKSKKKKNCC